MPTTDALIDGLLAMIHQQQQALAETAEALLTLKENSRLFPPVQVRRLLESLAEKVEGRTRPSVPAEEIDDEIEAAEAKKAAPDISEADTLTHFQRVVQYFVRRNNRPATSTEVREGTGLARGALGVVLYQTHRTEFRKASHPSQARVFLWSLTDAVYQKAQAGAAVASGAP